MPTIQGVKPFATMLFNFIGSPNPTPFTLKQALDAWATNVAFWEASSYGHVSFNGSTVQDWITLPLTNSDFIAKFSSPNGNGGMNRDRGGMIQYAKDNSGLDQSQFVGFIVFFCEPVGTAYTAGNGAIFEPTIASSTFVCHEMTHILGSLPHSFDFSGRKIDTWDGPGEYWDQADIMSADNCWFTAPTAGDVFSGAGPFHCMIWKDQFGWLPDTAVRRISTQEIDAPFDETLTLASRDSLSSNGYAAVIFRDISIEFAVARGFDAGLPSTGILIHQNVNGIPYVLVPDLANNEDQKFWFASEVCGREATGVDAGLDFWIWVQNINMANSTATINISTTTIAPLQAIQILAIRKAHSTANGGFMYINQVGVSDGNGGLTPINRSDVVVWIETGRNSFFVVGKDGSRAQVEVEGHSIQTVPDGSTEDNLLSLPSF